MKAKYYDNPEQLISFDTARLTKEKGFNIPVVHFFMLDGVDVLEKECGIQDINTNNPNNDLYSRPTQSLLQKWLFKDHTIWVQSTPIFNANELLCVEVTISSWRFPFIKINYNGYDVYDGLEKGLQEALKLLK